MTTPLVDLFRRGEAARDLKLLAARGALAARPPEQVGLLMLLAGDADAEIAAVAEATLQAIPREPLAAWLARSDVSSEVRSFFAARGVVPAGAAADASEVLLFEPAVEGTEAAAQDGGQTSPLERIAAMNVAQRVALAVKGSREERAILIRDPNKMVAVAVLSSPKITESEIESIARMGNVSDEILRIIAQTRAWVKNYTVMAALVRNAKTPLAVSMNLLPRLTDKDLRTLSTDRNVPDALRIAARKKLVLNR